MDTEVELEQGRRKPVEVRVAPDAVLEGLTEAQKKAVERTEGPVLVLAGPGSGKTRVITRRIAYLVGCGIPAWQILALTFTNKAAAEMRERVIGLLGEGAIGRGLTVTTFHSLCARLLRRYAGSEGVEWIKPSFVIYDSADQLAVIKRAIEGLDLSTSNFPPRSVLGRISDAKNSLIDAEGFAAAAGDFQARTVAKVYKEYQRLLRLADAVDFDDLMVLTVKMLRSSQRVREECRRRWQYLLIDEYQDTNRAQFVIAGLLAGEPREGFRPNICVVGDPDQSIYRWRGADIGNILDFEKQFTSAAVVPLGENFRSTGHIIAAADGLIRQNRRRKHKDLFTANAKGEKVEVVLCRDEHHEARLVLDWMRERKAEGTAWKEMAAFYRTNALSRVMEDELRTAGVPYIVARGTAFYQREEIKNALAYLRVVANPADEVSLGRIINTPARGIGDTTFDRVVSFAAERGGGMALMDALRVAGPALGLAARAQSALGKFVRMIDSWTGANPGDAMLTQPPPASLRELVERVVRESGLEAMYAAAKTDADQERLENLAELVSSAAEFESGFDPLGEGIDGPREQGIEGETEARTPELVDVLRAYLEQVALVADADAIDPAQGAVTLMTLHAAKGLEFDAVAMIGLEEGMLPHMRAVTEAGGGGDEEMEEERRLCFVGITRARKRLMLTAAKYRTVRGLSERTIPSRFLGELPKEHIVASDQAGFHEPGWDESPLPSLARSGAGGASRSDARRTGLAVGAVVRHPQFGIGRVVSVTSGQGARAQVKFRDAGTKTLVLEYARLEVLSAD